MCALAVGCAAPARERWPIEVIAQPPPPSGGGDPTASEQASAESMADDETIAEGEVPKFAWPLAATGITSFFGERRDPIRGDTGFHYGLDLEAPYGETVRAAAAGEVVYAGWNKGHGRMVRVRHRSGYETVYAHLSRILAYEGQEVLEGTPLGLVGNSGRSTGPHLHFEVHRDGGHLDPLNVLTGKGASLDS